MKTIKDLGKGAREGGEPFAKGSSSRTLLPSISVIVPAYNAAATLAETLEALAGQDVEASLVEIIVVDDGSTDATASIAAARGVLVVRQENQGPAAARNAGALRATGDILVFTDADCTPFPDFLAQLTRPFGDPAVSGVQGAYRTRQTGLVARFAQLEFEDRYRYAAAFPYLDLVATYAAAFRREVFLAQGGFDTSFPVADNEDTEFSYRLCRAGYRLVFAPRAMTYHRHPARLRDYLRIKARRAYWRLAACRDHPRKMLRDGYTPGLLRAQTALAGLCVLGVVLWPFTACGGWLAFLAAVALAVASAPFARFAARRDAPMAVVAPGIVCARAFAFALGAGLAVFTRLTGRAFFGKKAGCRPCG